MTKQEKLQAIAAMGVNIAMECPDFDHGINTGSCRNMNNKPHEETLKNCQDCWIDTLEGQTIGPTMMIQPTVDLAKKYSQQRMGNYEYPGRGQANGI